MESSSKKRKMAIMKLKEGLPRLRVSLIRLKLLGDMPNEILVKIFNFLPNQDIRCGVSLVCKKFYEICQNESLVPVKDLCIYGQPVGPKPIEDDDKAYYCLGGVAFLAHSIEKAVSDIIRQSKSLTFLKIKALNSKALNQLVLVSLRACPKLSHLEIIEDLHQMGD